MFLYFSNTGINWNHIVYCIDLCGWFVERCIYLVALQKFMEQFLAQLKPTLRTGMRIDVYLK